MAARRFVVLIRTIFFVYCLTVQIGDGCNYDGDMCNVEVECLIELEEEGDIDPRCRDVYYGPGPLYEDRPDTEFWIKFDPETYNYYAKNLTYTILRRPTKLDWIHSTRVQDCCSLTANTTVNSRPTTCTLPRKTTPEETFVVYIPREDEKSYCKYRLQERRGTIELCTTEDEEYCYDFDENGRMYRRNVFIPLSTDTHYPESTEHCFFPIASRYVDMVHKFNTTKTTFLLQKNITHTGTGVNIKAVYAGKEVNCQVEKTGSRDPVEFVGKYSDRSKEYVCFFSRIPTYNPRWISDPLCVEIQKEDNLTLTVTLSVLFALLAVLFIILAIVCVYRKCLRKMKFEKNIQQIPAGLVGLQRDDGGGYTIENQIIKEIPDEISFPAEHMEDVTGEKAVEIKVSDKDDCGKKEKETLTEEANMKPGIDNAKMMNSTINSSVKQDSTKFISSNFNSSNNVLSCYIVK